MRDENRRMNISRIRKLSRETAYVLTDSINHQSLFVYLFFIFHVFGLIK